MKPKKPLLAIVLALSTSIAVAQPPDNNNAGGQNKPPQNNQNPNDQPNGEGKHRPKSPLLDALDTNGDGIISADEIANASASLMKLDKNGDGQLTPDELRPQRPKDGAAPGGIDKDNGGRKNQRPQADQQQGPGSNPPNGQKTGGGQGGQGGPGRDGPPGTDGQNGRPRPTPPLMSALDTDKDGTLSADEIANASASLMKLDKNGDGQLTPEEYRPAPREKGPQDGNKGPGNATGNPPPAAQDNNAANPKKRPQAE